MTPDTPYSLPRCTLRVREHQHLHPDRADETVIEVLRGDEVLAQIYGSYEGVHVVSPLLSESHNEPFRLDGVSAHGVVIPLISSADLCPWCEGARVVTLNNEQRPCPVCSGKPALDTVSL